MGKVAVAVVLTVMMVLSMNSVLAEEPTIGQRIDATAADLTETFNKHAGDTVGAVSATVRSWYDWFGDKLRGFGFHVGNDEE